MEENESGKRTLGQRAFDNIWFLLMLGMAFPGIFYLGWGMLEIFVFNNTQLKTYIAKDARQSFLLQDAQPAVPAPQPGKANVPAKPAGK